MIIIIIIIIIINVIVIIVFIMTTIIYCFGIRRKLSIVGLFCCSAVSFVFFFL